MNRIPVLATLLTLGNGVCGFAAIAYASKICLHDKRMSPEDVNYYFLLSAGLILVAMVFDMLDGCAARLSRTASEFGGQLDSLCDAISFGAAPAFLLLRLGQQWELTQPIIAKTVAVVAAFYLACAVLRLARFNTKNTPDANSHKRFKGLPSPAAAGCLASIAILRSLSAEWGGLDPELVQGFVAICAPVGAFIAALLMVSGFSYPHFGRLLRGRRQFQVVVQALLVLAVIALAPQLAFFLVFWTYALLAPVRYLVVHLAHGELAEHTPSLKG